MFSLLSLVYLLGIIQGVLLFFSLFFRKRNLLANKLLALLILILALLLTNGYLERINLFIRYPHLLLITFPLPFLFGPIIYLYSIFLTKSAGAFRKKDAWHLIPFVAVVAYLLPFYFKADWHKIITLGQMIGVLNLLTAAYIVCGFLYCLLAYRLLRKYQQTLKEFYSHTGKLNLNWLRVLLATIFVLWGLFLVEFIIDRDIVFTYIGISAAIYVCGYFSLRLPEITGFSFSEPGDAQTTSGKIETAPLKSRYEKEATDEKWSALLAYMHQEKPHIEPSLTLAQLAESLSLSTHLLSYLINSRADKNFFHFVNGFRVEEVKCTLADPRSRSQDLLAIAFAAGFSTKATFNAIFKKYTGMTPSQYRDSLLKK